MLENWKNSRIDAIFEMFRLNINTGSAGWNPIKYFKNKMIDFGCGKYVSYLNKLQNKLKNISAIKYILILGILTICIVIIFGMLWNMLFSSCLMCYSICKYIIEVCYNCHDKFLMLMIATVIIYCLKCKCTTVKISKNIIILNLQVNYLSQLTKKTVDLISDEEIYKMASDSDKFLAEDFELIS